MKKKYTIEDFKEMYEEAVIKLMDNKGTENTQNLGVLQGLILSLLEETLFDNINKRKRDLND